MAQHTSSITYLDATGEKAALKIYNGAVTAVSIAGFLSDFGDLQAATDAITLGTRHKNTWVGDDDVISNAIPANNQAQREIKLMVTYRGNTSQKLFHVTIPTLDLDAVQFVPGGGDAIVLADGGVIAAWVTAFETMARTPDSDLETVTVVKARAVGRNI